MTLLSFIFTAIAYSQLLIVPSDSNVFFVSFFVFFGSVTIDLLRRNEIYRKGNKKFANTVTLLITLVCISLTLFFLFGIINVFDVDINNIQNGLVLVCPDGVQSLIIRGPININWIMHMTAIPMVYYGVFLGFKFVDILINSKQFINMEEI